MVVRSEKSFIHWNYFLALESDLANVSRYIEFTEENYATYSIELSHLLIAAASEVDVIAKAICGFLEPNSQPVKIHHYQKIILARCPEFLNETVYIPRFNLELQPWLDWKENKPPEWWSSYNGVKHQRGERFGEANLGNVLYSMGGLLVSEFYYYKLKFEQVGIHRIDIDPFFDLLPYDSGLLRLKDSYYPRGWVRP